MGKIDCIETLKTSSYVLSKTGVLFTKKLCTLDITKIVLNILLDLVINIIIVLNIKNSLEINNVKLTNWMVCLLLPMENYVAKRLTLLVNKKCLISLLDILNSEVFNNHSEKQNRHIQMLNKISRLIFRYFAFTMTVSLTVFCLLPFIVDIKMMIPPPFETKQFEVVYKLLHFLSAFYLAVNTTGLDMFYMTLLGLGNAQLKILEERLLNLLEDSKQIQRLTEVVACDHIDSITERILKDCIILHKMIIE